MCSLSLILPMYMYVSYFVQKYSEAILRLLYTVYYAKLVSYYGHDGMSCKNILIQFSVKIVRAKYTLYIKKYMHYTEGHLVISSMLLKTNCSQKHAIKIVAANTLSKLQQ